MQCILVKIALPLECILNKLLTSEYPLCFNDQEEVKLFF